MLLSELAEASGVSAASIKYYRREGLLPAGERLTATRQEYGPAHLERLELIQVLREVAQAPIARIARLTTILDDPEQSLLSALEAAQLIALGLPAEEAEAADAEDGDAGAGNAEHRLGEDAEHPSIAPLLSALGWPELDTAPRRALDALLHSLESWGMPTDLELLLRYAEPIAAIARADVTSIRDQPGQLTGELTEGRTEELEGPLVSADVQVMRAVTGAIAYDRMIQLLRALGHTSYSILRARDSG